MPEDFTPGAGEDGAQSFDEFLARYLAGEQARAERSIDLSRFLSARTQDALQEAGRFALGRGQRELDALHVLHVLVGRSPAKDAVARLGADPAAIARAAESRLPAAGAPAHVDGAVVAGSVQRALFHAFQVARAAGSTYVDPDHLFFALVLAQDAPAGQILAQAGVTAEALTQGVRETVVGGEQSDAPTEAASTTPNLDRFGTDLTARAAAGELDPVIGRTDEIEQTIEILSRRTKNNPVLIGEAAWARPRSSRDSPVRSSRDEVPEQLRDNPRGLARSGRDARGCPLPRRFRGAPHQTMDEISASDKLVVFIDEVHTLVGARAAAATDRWMPATSSSPGSLAATCT